MQGRDHWRDDEVSGLYHHARAGTKRLITEFLKEVDASMAYIFDTEPGT